MSVMTSVIKMTGIDLMIGKTSLNPLDDLSTFFADGATVSSMFKNHVATARSR